jgi:hypothetical protein
MKTKKKNHLEKSFYLAKAKNNNYIMYYVLQTLNPVYNIGPNQHNLHCTSSFIQHKIVQDFGGATFRVAKFKN